MIFKKAIIILLSLCTITACSTISYNKENGLSETLTKVEVTIPKEFLQDDNFKEMIKEAEEDGIKEMTRNKDHSITLTMSEEQQEKILKDLVTEMDETIDEIEKNEDYPSIKTITYNDSFTEYKMEVNREVYEDSFDGFSVFGLGMSGILYQLFRGKEIKDSKIIVYVEDESSGEVFDKIPYPEALEQQDQ